MRAPKHKTGAALNFDRLIIGGGVIGLAIAYKLSAHSSVLLLEQNTQFGQGTSSRNSEVIHAGLYYAPNSLKERLCVRGNRLLYEFCQTHQIAHRAIGKLIVAPQTEHPKLMALAQTAKRLDIPLERLNRQQLNLLEPKVAGQEALFSSSTGIIDSHAYMQTLAHQAERQGALLMCRSRVMAATEVHNGWQVHIDTEDGPIDVEAITLINAAGLEAQALAAQLGMAEPNIPALYPCRGHYFSYAGKRPFQHLIYPLPQDNLVGLGIHATLDLGGQVRFGPDSQYLNNDQPFDYAVDESLRESFAKAIRSYFPDLDDSLLSPAYAGIRPKLHAADQPSQDFAFIESGTKARAIHCFEIESPGLTASLAIGEHIERLLLKP